MPYYEYESPDGERIEVFYHMTDDKPESINQDGKTYTRVFSLPNVGVDLNKPKTVGSLAEKNTERMIKEGKLKPKKEKKIPFWRKNKKINFDLAKLTPKQKMKYIREGKT